MNYIVANGEDFLVNTVAWYNQLEPAVISLTSGGYIIQWYDEPQSIGGPNINSQRYQIYDADGARVGFETMLAQNDTTEVQIVALGDGGFMIMQCLQNESGSFNFFRQTFDAAGNAEGPSVALAAFDQNKQSDMRVIPRLSDQNLCAHWRSPIVMMRQG